MDFWFGFGVFAEFQGQSPLSFATALVDIRNGRLQLHPLLKRVNAPIYLARFPRWEPESLRLRFERYGRDWTVHLGSIESLFQVFVEAIPDGLAIE